MWFEALSLLSQILVHMKHLALIFSFLVFANVACANAQSVGVACLTALPCDESGNLINPALLNPNNPCFDTYFSSYLNFCVPKQQENVRITACKDTQIKVNNLQKKLRQMKRQIFSSKSRNK